MKVGSWDDENGIIINGMESTSEGWESSLQNRSLTVTTILNPPYMMIKESTNVLQKNDQYEAKFESTSF